MASIESKMDWQVKQYMDGTIQYEVHDTGERYGTVCVPTGGGKSGMMIRDMIWHIDHMPNGKKLVINVSAPILKLGRQLLGDIVSTFEGIYGKNNGKFLIFLNSSDNGIEYKNITKEFTSIRSFKGIKAFENHPTARIAIVVSCHDSLKHFADRLDYLKTFATILDYLDESHTVINLTERWGFADDTKDDELSEEEKVQKSILEKIMDSNCVYAFSATPDVHVTSVINSKNSNSNHRNGGYHIVDISPNQLINEGTILSPVVYCWEMMEHGRISAEHAMRFMELCKKDEPNINHKILISCDNTEHLEWLEKELHSRGCIVFSTCSKKGAKSNGDEDHFGNFHGVHESEFVDKVDEYNGDCYVLHIRQLRAGIDIRTLTDAIISNHGGKICERKKVEYIQTIGRILRPYKGERPEELNADGRTFDDRKKKHGNVLFLIENGKDERVRRQTINFTLQYYGLTNVKVFVFDNQNNPHPWKKHAVIPGGECGTPDPDFIENDIEILKCMMKKFIENQLIPMNKALVAMGGRVYLDKILKQMEHKFANEMVGEFPVSDFISNRELMNYASDVLNNYGHEQLFIEE